MATSRKSALKRINQSEIPGTGDKLGPALAPVAVALAEELAVLLAAVLDGRKKRTLDRLSQALSDAVPELLRRAVEQELLAGEEADSERCAMLVAALHAGATPASE
ncbi:hypothetical protein F6X40_40665 [Paraburkholderia sp. UCT31]|uniref:hypothetical protein n=1 Tax=Paraburkholderia sp. UCT31 TaxID=2615209 RepID=UPI001CA38E46|nr:hypothetical protein [Paraburkholderia sp. UCT31]MBC8742788.1 hypothetical protein [Paraburkholderia sp. UCT31]